METGERREETQRIPASFEDEILQQHPWLPHLFPEEAVAVHSPRMCVLERKHQACGPGNRVGKSKPVIPTLSLRAQKE